MNTMTKICDALPPLRRRTRPNLACFVGFLTGGIGLAVYFRSFVDAIVVAALLITFALLYDTVSEFGVLPGLVLPALYGYFRAENSNRRLAETSASAPTPAPSVTS